MNFGKAQSELRALYPPTSRPKLIGYSSDDLMTEFNFKTKKQAQQERINSTFEIKPSNVEDEYYVYIVRGQKRYYKTEQDLKLLMHNHPDAEYLGVGTFHSNVYFKGRQIVNGLTQKQKSKLSKLPTPKKELFAQIVKKPRQKPPLRRDVVDGQFTCCYCECALTKSNYTIEHLVPKDRGGKNTVNNLRPSCEDCNTEKDNLFLHSYIMWLNCHLDRYLVNSEDYNKLQIKIKNANKLAFEIENNY